MLHDNGGKREFRWESGYEKTWSAIREDESGRLVTTLEQLIHDAHTQIRKKRRRIGVGSTGFVRLGMMRHLFLIIDLSQAMNEQDLKPNRLICTVKAACTFVREYFDQNPISQLGIIVTSDRRAERLTELSG
ncbi:transcription initiation factor TFIIH subunit 2 [Schistosoma bovis]|uniref:Transcription initiation factor TFIIH subunit 2 n=1 Tax=Schistosoma bovis TaxID=6184 RepID=A0A430QGB1_SCHBO|nr:transcription initiation factor TFIIH subunit 2 [Schistosoma bovis]